MFKAKIIEDKKYYSFKHKALIFYLILNIPLGIVSNFYALPLKVVVIGLILLAIPFVFMVKYFNESKKTFGKRELVVSSDQIVVKDNKKGSTRNISFSDVNQINVNEHYGTIPDDLGAAAKELKGKFTEHYLEIETNGKTERFDFIIDSYYMAKQFQKIVDAWIIGKRPVIITQ